MVLHLKSWLQLTVDINRTTFQKTKNRTFNVVFVVTPFLTVMELV